MSAATALGCADQEPISAEKAPTGALSQGYATRVVSFAPGSDAGFGTEDDVLGPPHGAGATMGNATDVLSLGAGGEIVLAFDGAIVDAAGPDFTVFENAFVVAGGTNVYAEYGEVAVSADGVTFTAFPCRPPGDRATCAGWHPVLANPDSGVSAFDPSVSGGDVFDLAAIGVASARYVRIRDLQTLPPAGKSAGFDLDAIAVRHLQE